MDYIKIRKKLNKYSKGGMLIPKYQSGASIQNQLNEYLMAQKALEEAQKLTNPAMRDEMVAEAQKLLDDKKQVYEEAKTELQSTLGDGTVALSQEQRQDLNNTNAAFGALGFNGVNTTPQKAKTVEVKDENGNVIGTKEVKVGLSEGSQMAMGITSQGISKALNIADEMTMGDKNFSAQSQAADSAVHGASGALMKSGNPYAMVVGAAIEGLNFITKAGGRTVPGFDVNINNSGYGNLGHQESSSGLIWDNWTGKTGRKLAKRNEQARMAIAAADISEDQAYQQEARANSITNVLEANQIALAGGIDTSLLGN